jgi:fatty acid desaturase
MYSSVKQLFFRGLKGRAVPDHMRQSTYVYVCGTLVCIAIVVALVALTTHFWQTIQTLLI